jgi:Ca-activated chloride channel family protein
VPPPGTVRERLDRPADAAKQDRDEGKGEADRRQLASEEAVAESPAPLTAGRAVAKQSRVAKEQHFAAQPGVATANLDAIRAPSEPLDRENYAHFDDNPLKRVVDHPVSTFSIDVDTGAYSNARRMLNAGRLPVQDAVRVEEFINYFGYDYAAPPRPTWYS